MLRGASALRGDNEAQEFTDGVSRLFKKWSGGTGHVFPFLYLSQHSSCLAFKRLLLTSSSYLLPNVTSSLETPLIPKAEGDSLLPMPRVEFILSDERGLSSRPCPHQTLSQTSPPSPPPRQLSSLERDCPAQETQCDM